MQALLHPAAESYVQPHWAPPVDIYRMRDGWLVKFDLAGVLRSDLQLTVSGTRLTLRGRRRDWCVEQGAACSAYSMEITYSEFERTIELPGEIENMRITTDYRDGMLLVQLVAQKETE
ncbi:MAG: Hsp20/alpha crystallin family protein [Deltaproteobacteria bacterium]